MIVEHGELANGTSVLQLKRRLLLDTEHDAVFPADADGAGALSYGFESIFDLF